MANKKDFLEYLKQSIKHHRLQRFNIQWFFYDKGMLIDDVKIYDLNGYIKESLCVKNNIRIGTHQYFYLNGQLKKEIVYINDIIDGE
jgi:antitoxin component YwqK of YwqJK toxin-antitoxin module